MRRDSVIEKKRILNLTRISHNAIISDDYILTDIGVMTDLAVSANDSWTFDHDSILDECAFANKNLGANVSNSVAMIF